MTTKVKLSQFTASTERFAKKSATAADKNKDGKLARAEARSLPVDLRDDYSRQAKLKATITPAAFARDQAAYVARSGRKADKNQDGVLTATEARALPADLKNNFANFAASQSAAVTLDSFVGKGKGKKDILGGVAVVRLPLSTGIQNAQRKLMIDSDGVGSFAAAWKAKPADVAAALAHPAGQMDFFNDLLFHSTGTSYQNDYPDNYTPAGLTVAPITNAKALGELTQVFQDGVRSAGPKVVGGPGPVGNAAAMAVVAGDTKKLLAALDQPGTKLVKLSWTNHDDASFDGYFAINAATGELNCLGHSNEP